MTRARLPSHFLLPLSTTFDAPGSEFDPDTGESREVQPRLVPTHASELSKESPAPSSSYIFNQRSMLEYVNGKKRWAKLVSPRMQEYYGKKVGKKRGSVQVEKEWRWDGGMADEVLERLRHDVFVRLQACITDRERIRPMMPGEDGSAISCLLRLRQEPDIEIMLDGTAAVDTAVYNIHVLLGEERLSTLELDNDANDAGYVIVLAHPRTVRLQMALGRLAQFCESGTV